MKKIIVALVLVISGCAVTPTHNMVADFDEAVAKRLTQPGVNVVRGSALIRQAGGGTVNCAGLTIRLIPKTSYATERIVKIYSNTIRGFSPAHIVPPEFLPDDPRYYANILTSTCNAQGFFEFDRVADGEFYLVSNIVWHVANKPQGGTMMRHISVVDGQVVDVVLSP